MKGELTTSDGGYINNPNFREKVVNISSRFSWLQGGERTLTTIALLATLVAATIVLILWTSAKNYVPLYGNQEHYDKANILEILDKEQFTFRIDTDSGNIMVPQDKLADARITLASRGIKAAMPDGVNNVGDKIHMGTSQFMETKQYQHALEGELARTMINMEGIRNARVHLAIPKRSLFIGRQEQQSAASVMVDLAPGYELKPEQVEAIVSLVAGSVPGLDPKTISVVDQRGKLLTGELFEETPVGKDSSKKLAFIDKLERNIEQRASIMLLPILGDGNYRIQVSADVDFSVVEETRESVDPNTVVVNESTKTDSSLDQLAMGIPGSLANQPPQTQQNQQGQEESDNQRTTERNEVQRQFDSGRAVTHTQYEVGRLKTMSVSVLVNEGAAGTADGWSDARLAVIGEMVRTATGFQTDRGDRFNIASFQFVEAKGIPEPTAGLPWWQMPIVQEYARYVFATLIALSLILFGVRPLVSSLVNGKKSAENSEGKELALSPETRHLSQASASAHVQQLAQSSEGRANVTAGNQTNAAETGLTEATGISLPGIGSEFEEQIRHMQYLASKESERVSAVIKYWVEQGVEIESSKS